MKISKRKNIINNYNWYFQFDTWNKSHGKLIIGSLPHEDYPKKYNEDDFLETYIMQDFSEVTKNIKIEFNDIYTESNNLTFSIKTFAKNAIFDFDSDINIGPKKFETKIKEKFLNDFLMNKKCFEESFKRSIDYFNELKFYYCEINAKEKLYDFYHQLNLFLKI